MECSKCHKIIPENTTVCPHCKKVLALECPNCHSVEHNSVCESCGYIILEKCAKCGRLVPTFQETCKCGYPVKNSIAYNECENDEFASMNIKFGALKNIRNLLGSHSLYKKFQTKLKNMLLAQFSGFDGKIISSGDEYYLNFNKELSLSTSANKAIRLALKIVNSFSQINLKLLKELGTSLKLNITITKKQAEDLLSLSDIESNVKLLSIKKESKKYLHGMQIILDQFVQDSVAKEFKTDSLYALEHDGTSIMYYEIILDNYVLPPNEEINNANIVPNIKTIKKNLKQDDEDGLYSFNVFDIKAKCKFEKSNACDVIKKLDSNKIISIKADKKLLPATSSVMEYFDRQGIKVLHAVCTDTINSKPWGILGLLFKEFYGLSEHNSLIDENFEVKVFTHLKNLLFEKRRKAGTAEDARFAYMEDFCNFLASLKNCVIYIENFELIDDTTIQTLELYFDKFKNINVNFIFSTDTKTSVHSKIKTLLRTKLYTEYELNKTPIEELISNIKEDASDFINSFYYEKISENFNGSKLYFDHALKYLENKDVLLNFEDRLIIKNNSSIVIPPDIETLIKNRIKHFAANMDFSLVIAYSNYLGPRLDFKMLTKLGIKDIEKTAAEIKDAKFGYVKDETLYLNNFSLLHKVVQASLKPQVEEMLIKNILSALGEGLDTTIMINIMNKIGMHKDEYFMSWKNSQFAMFVGDFDAYLKNCLRFLSIIESLDEEVSKEEIEASKMEVFQNILISLYSYSPTKIYSIEHALLIDAINSENDEQIVKLSNLMLQGALISSNYTDALSLLHNILERMPNPNLVVDGTVNNKFLLLSLVNIEILFNIGEFSKCIETSDELLSVINPNIIDEIKPASFSKQNFIEHIQETYRLVCFAKIIRGDGDLTKYFEKLRMAFGENLPDMDCIIAVRDFLSGKDYRPSNAEEATAFSKMIYLILQEFTLHSNDYKTFAQNIYQAKLLAHDLHQTLIEKLCELLIAYSYMNIGVKQKAEYMYNDLLKFSENSAIFIINTVSQYLISLQKLAEKDIQEALYIINDALATLQKRNNDAKLFYVLFEKLFIDIIKENEISSVDINSELNSLYNASENNEFARIVGERNTEEHFDG